ncbi:aldo/keto reductase [Gemmata sp.]|uniref:aldo/keto reductase n=1 Tax=Gemmata sp. TaxID=1914242 RepID=UPI003F70531D
MTDLPTDETRREFLHAGVAATAAAAIGAASASADDKKPGEGLPMRPIGNTGARVSILCLGGWHIGDVKDKDEAVKIMHAAIDEGVNFFDNCWDYHDGGSEEIMGRALAADGGKWRKKVFLMTKVCSRKGPEVRKQIEDSLKRLQTDVIDLMQMHEINWDNDPEWVAEQGGLAELLKMQKEGKVKHVGFTGHKSPHIHLKMMPVHKWDTVQCPINVCDHFYRSFAQQVIPAAKKQGTAVIGMKALGGGKGKIVKEGVATAEECLRFAMSQDVVSVVSGMDSMDVLKKNVATARNFKPMQGDELEKLLAKVKPHAGDGRHERFKSTIDFDGPYHRKQHGFDEPPK